MRPSKSYLSLLKRTAALTLTLSMALASGNAAFAKTALTPEQIAKIIRAEGGTLLNVPGRELDRYTKDAEYELNRVVQALIQKDPEAQKFEWRVRIVQSDRANAWASQSLYSPDASKGAEDRRLREFYQVKGEKPIAFLSVTTAALKVLKTEAQLAFLLGHEMTHHTEGHLNAKRSGVTSKPEQAFEVAADKGGVKRILGLYSLDSAIETLELLFQEEAKRNPVEDFEGLRKKANQLHTASQTYLADHHQNGVRLSLLQLQVEELKRMDKRGMKGVNPAMPKALSFLADVKTSRGEAMTNAKMQMLREVLRLHISDARFSATNLQDVQKQLSDLPRLLDVDGQSKLIDAMMTEVISQTANPSARAQAILLALFNNMRATPTDFIEVDKLLSRMDAATARRLVRVLGGLESSPEVFEKLRQNTQLEDLYLKSKNFQALAIELAKVSQSWRDFNESSRQNAFKTSDLKKTLLAIALDENETRGRVELSHLGPLRKEWSRAALEAFAGQSVNVATSTDRVALRNLLGYAHRSDVSAYYAKEVGTQVWNAALAKGEEAMATLHEREFSRVTVQSSVEQRSQAIASWLSSAAADREDAKLRDVEKFFGLLSSFESKDTQKVLSQEISRNFPGFYNAWLPAKILKAFAESSTLAKFNAPLVLFHLARQFGEEFVNVVARDAALGRQVVARLGVGSIEKFIAGPGDLRMDAQSDTVELARMQTRFLILARSGAISVMAPEVRASLVHTVLKFHETSQTSSKLPDGAGLLFDYAMEAAKGQSEISKKVELIERLVKVLGTQFVPSAQQKKTLASLLGSSFDALKGEALIETLKASSLRRGLPDTKIAELLARAVGELVPVDAPKEKLTAVWKKLSDDFDFKLEGRAVGQELRNHLATAYKSQPSDVQAAFALPGATDTEIAMKSVDKIRAWSAIAEFLQAQSATDQLKAIDFLMGREAKLPDFFEAFDRRSPTVKTRDAAFQLRDEMASADMLVRMTFLNSLFKGSAALAKPENRPMLVDYLMTSIVPENKEVAKTLAHALIEAEGANSSFVLSAILAEQPEKGAKAVTEQGMLKVMLEAYGVPGVKLAQYLAFTGEFKEYEAVLAKYQDSAPTPGYFDILTYMENEVRGLLDTKRFKFTRLLGAGSVNLAIEYYDIEKKTFNVFNIPREHIMQKTKIDFARFQVLMKKLAARSTDAMDFS